VWARERSQHRQRERLRKTYQLGEKILAAESAETILERLAEALPDMLDVTNVRVHVHNRASRTLEAVAPEGQPQLTTALAVASGETCSAAAWCFQYRAAFTIPDPDRSPFRTGGENGRVSGPLLFLPMLAQTEATGVLELERPSRSSAFTRDEQELAQHLANQAGVAIRLMDQRSVQEQLFRTEKMAAVGRLISGVVNELQTPLERIEELAARAANKPSVPGVDRDLGAIAAEAGKASNIVSRLVSYASSAQGDARPIQVGTLLRKLIDFREGDWKASGIRVRDLTTREPLAVLGSEEQLEQVFLNLLVHAEQALAESQQKMITIRTSILARRLLVEITFTGPPASRKAGEVAAALGVTRSVIAGHGGEVRLIEKSNADPRFEVELPLTVKERAPASPAPSGRPADSGRRLTALVIDNEEASQRHVVGLLAARGFRVVPVDNADKGLDLAHRMRFDAAICSANAPGLNWVELSEQMQPRVGAFVLVADRYDADLAADFEGERRLVVSKPVGEPDLDRVLHALESRVPVAKNGAA
jgi:K+-sensing histidine kinase KdpD/CheY-like chemotaxis protein